MISFPFFKQYDSMDCGPSCLRMIAKFYGKNYNQKTISQLCEVNREGVSLLGISDAAEKIGFRSLGVKLTDDQLEVIQLPCILHWRQYHFIVLYKIKNNKYYLADPAEGLITIDKKTFKKSWEQNPDNFEGIALLLSPTPEFYEKDNDKNSAISWSFLFKYLFTYRKLVIQLIFSLGLGSLLQVVTPFLTQSIVDIGINTRNLNFVYIILIAQLALIIGRVSIDFIRSWILLHISTRINISILTDFLIKLMKLPMGFFDTKMTGDIMQRMNDQKNIQSFLTGSTLTTIFSAFNLLVFSVVLAYYNSAIFFCICNKQFLLYRMDFLISKPTQKLKL